LFLHAVGGFGFITLTAELVGSAARPPTAFSTIQGTFTDDRPLDLSRPKSKLTLYLPDTARGFGLWLRSATFARCGALFFFTIDNMFNIT
jgi:hypothetical protein